MKFGVNILNFGPGANPGDLLQWAQVSEALGYHSVLISDHVAITPSVGQRYPEPYYDTFATLAWIAGQTTRVQLGTTVVVLPYRHPVLTARLAASIDRFSNGRFVLGVGVGNAADEFAALGQPHNRRGRLANECLEAIIALWTAEEPVSYAGRLVRFDDVSPIGTVQEPHPPIWVGGMSEPALRRAVKYGDGWHPIIRSMEAVREALPQIRSMAGEMVRRVPDFCPRIRLDLRPTAVEGERQPGVGSVEQVRADLQELAALGAKHVTLDWYTGDLEATTQHERGWGMLAMMADKVIDLEKEMLR